MCVRACVCACVCVFAKEASWLKELCTHEAQKKTGIYRLEHKGKERGEEKGGKGNVQPVQTLLRHINFYTHTHTHVLLSLIHI